ncbi:uncharacterized protein LOC132299916 [Cornus florida]|uniref:uncharacterized protein LOC132299916 n=1 Tax=Cornus florida TaxID=4283 RepID=UPI00289A2334|nr:uncharacterized protein LOC132299916 [Cornus florida]XP_059652790.1 uncharacterized protein LOC132299916 [Cornus florida]XP_059652791.1 uncharacterized protein LOC132299916 [Cornus florida]
MLIRTQQWRLKNSVVHFDDKKLVQFDYYRMIVKVQTVNYNHALVEEENYTVTKQFDPIPTTSLVDERWFSEILHPFLSTVGITRISDHNIDRILSICRAMTSLDTISSSPTAVPVLDMKILVVIKLAETQMRRALPASKSSVEALETEMLFDGSCSMDQCIICLEKFRVGFDMVSRLPCNHIYHGDCISRWLETSHFCPVCRFEFPTDPL